MGRACARVAALFGLLILADGGAARSRLAAAETRFVDYLYVEANEGGSSGGHVALRFGADVFHFQQEGAALIRMRRDGADLFDFRYAMLGNRPIHETRVGVSEDTYARLHDAFTRRLLVQAAQYERLEALEGDVALFAQWPRPGTSVAPAVPVRAAGYFLPDGFVAGGIGGDHSAALGALRAQVAAAGGDDAISRRAMALRAALAAWQPAAVRAADAPLARDSYASFPPTASTAFAELVDGLTALEVLDATPALRADAYRIADAVPALDARERQALAGFARQLSADLAALAASPRADFGYPLLLGMARLAAIEASLASGRLVVLDAFAADAPSAPLPEGSQRNAMLDALAAQLRPAAEQARQELFAAARFREADYTQFETAVNRLLEVDGARRNGMPMRTEPGLLLPARPAGRGKWIAAPLSETTARAELDAARAAVADYRARLATLYRYNLLTQNCVSEIFATIDAALGDAAGTASGPDAVAAESRRRLGGVVRTGPNLNFIPVVSAGAVARTYTAVARRTRPSYRQLRLGALAAEEPWWRVALRESNTLTSTVYHPGPRDSAFLFFTDDAGLLRPVLGAANLVVAIADGALGLATWPVDDGARLRAGLRGALFSLPELAFVNLRKGSMAYVDAATRSPPATTAAGFEPTLASK